MTQYFFKNCSGQFWSGNCWGVEQAAQDYNEDNLPDEVGGYEVLDATLPIEDRVYINPEDQDNEYDCVSIVRGFQR